MQRQRLPARSFRRIDHVVVAVHELDRTCDFYRDLGFCVGARNRHPWGTENRLIQFASSFIELISIGDNAVAIQPHDEGQFSFGAFVQNYLHKREGLAMLALNSTDAKADAASFARKGIGNFAPFSFERRGQRPDGSDTHVAFSLVFAVDANAPDVAFFVCQQHFPDNFWNAEFQQHANGAIGISGVTLTAFTPDTHTPFFEVFSGAAGEQAGVDKLLFRLDGGRIEVVRSEGEGGGSLAAPLLTSFSVRVGDLDRAAYQLQAAAIPFTVEGNRLTVPPHVAFGVEIVFESQ